MSKLQRRALLTEGIIYLSLASMIWQLSQWIADHKVWITYYVAPPATPSSGNVEVTRTVFVINHQYHFNSDLFWLLVLVAVVALDVRLRHTESPYAGTNKKRPFGRFIEHLTPTATGGALLLLAIGGIVWLVDQLPWGHAPWISHMSYFVALGWLILIAISTSIIWWHLPNKPWLVSTAEQFIDIKSEKLAELILENIKQREDFAVNFAQIIKENQQTLAQFDDFTIMATDELYRREDLDGGHRKLIRQVKKRLAESSATS
jgi:hypothetical protein